jgi:hypothetical protein
MQPDSLTGYVNGEWQGIDQTFVRPLRMVIKKYIFKNMARLIVNCKRTCFDRRHLASHCCIYHERSTGLSHFH